jgi:hypothetical protein
MDQPRFGIFRYRKMHFVLVCVILFVFFSCCLDTSDTPRMCQSDYYYRISVTTEQPVTNVTFLIPLPLQGGYPKFESQYLNESMIGQFKEYHAKISGDSLRMKDKPFTADYPQNYHFTFIALDNGTFLKITADSLTPEKPVQFYFGLLIDPASPYLAIDTLHPGTNESGFTPEFNRSRTYTRNTYFNQYSFGNNYSWVHSSGTDYRYDIPVYAEYSAKNKTAPVTISSSVVGKNSWRYLYDNWGGNDYTDSFSLSLTGDTFGWYPAEGSISIGSGDYPKNLFDMPGPPPGTGWSTVANTEKFSPRKIP